MLLANARLLGYVLRKDTVIATENGSNSGDYCDGICNRIGKDAMVIRRTIIIIIITVVLSLLRTLLLMLLYSLLFFFR